MTKKQEEARKRLIQAAPHLRIAEKQAEIAGRPNGKVILAVGYENPDRTGQITARLDCGPFIDDLIALLGFDSMAELIAAGEP